LSLKELNLYNNQLKGAMCFWWSTPPLYYSHDT
jgi:hypothetical protein